MYTLLQLPRSQQRCLDEMLGAYYGAGGPVDEDPDGMMGLSLATEIQRRAEIVAD